MTLDNLSEKGWTLAEVLHKKGRVRQNFEGPHGDGSALSIEEGWAVRAGRDVGSVFLTGSGTPPIQGVWPEPSAPALRLPEPQAVEEWEPPRAVESPLMTEAEGRGILTGVLRELRKHLPRAQLVRGVLSDGLSETVLLNSRGVEVTYLSRLASLDLEAAEGGRPNSRVLLQEMGVAAREFSAQKIAGRLADALSVRAGGQAPERDRGDMVLAPPVAASLLAGISPLFAGAAGAREASGLRDRRDRIGSSHLTIVDDGRLSGGALAAPVDGEGWPTRRTVLMDEGRYVQPIVDWREADPPKWRASGCVRRSSWRDWPRRGPTHLYVEPHKETLVANLVSGVARGYYLLDSLGPPRIDLDSDQLALPVCGFGLLQGKPGEPFARAWLVGSVSAFLKGVRAVADDLTFFPLGAMIGAPTLLIGGIELRRSPG